MVESNPATKKYLRGLKPEKLAEVAAQVEDPDQVIPPEDLTEARVEVQAEIDRRVIESLDGYQPQSEVEAQISPSQEGAAKNND